MDLGRVRGSSQGDMWIEILSCVVGIGLGQRFVERDERLRLRWLKKHYVFKLPVFFKCHIKSGVFGANGFEDLSHQIRLIGGHKGVEKGEVCRHLCE